MPFDGKDDQEPFPYIPGPEGLRVLALALRAPMPEGFGLDFGTKYQNDECGTVGCAMGLAKTLWFTSRARRSMDISAAFNISHFDVAALFVPNNLDYAKITPAMVADAIDRYLDSGDIWPQDLRP